MGHSECEKHRENLHLLTEGLIQADEGLQQHLASCSGCSARLRELRAVAELLAALPQPEPPRTFAAQVRAKVQVEAQRGQAHEWGGREWCVAAAYLLLAAFAIWLLARFVYVPWGPLKSGAVAAWEATAAEAGAMATDPARWFASVTSDFARAGGTCLSGWSTIASHLVGWRAAILVALALVFALNVHLYRTTRIVIRPVASGVRRG